MPISVQCDNALHYYLKFVFELKNFLLSCAVTINRLEQQMSSINLSAQAQPFQLIGKDEKLQVGVHWYCNFIL